MKRALRDNEGKLRWDLLPVEWEEELVKILTKGAVKYSPDNWKESINTQDHESFKQDRMASAMRHIAAYRKGEVFDKENLLDVKTTHLGHAAWNLLAIMYYDMNVLKSFYGEEFHKEQTEKHKE